MEPTPHTPPRWLRRLALWVLAFPTALVGLVGLLLLGLQTSWGAEQMRQLLERVLSAQLQHGKVEIGSLEGNFIRTLNLYQVVLRDAAGRSLLTLDTLQLAYLPEALLKNRVHLRQVVMGRLHIALTQQADSTWDLLQLLPQTTDTATAASESALAFWIDHLTLRQGTARVRLYNPKADSIWHLHHLQLGLDSLRVPARGWPELSLKMLEAIVQPPGAIDSVHLTVRLTLHGRRFTLDTLQMLSGRSLLKGQGTLLLPTDTSHVEGIDFHLEARPLALADLIPFVAVPDSRRTLEGSVTIQGTGRLINVKATANADTGGYLTLSATFTPLREGPVQYTIAASAEHLDLAFMGGPSGKIEATVQADLRGPSLEALEGTAQLAISQASIGSCQLEPTNLEVRFEQGTGYIVLQSGLQGAQLQLEGQGRPFDTAPWFRFSGTLTDLDPSRFTADTSWSGQLNVAFEATGQGGTHPLNLDGRLVLLPSWLNRATIEGGALRVRLRGDTTWFALEAQLAGGSLHGQGQLRLASAPMYSITPLVAEQLDVAALMGDTLKSTLSGRLQLIGSGQTPETLRLEALVTLDSLIYGPYHLTAVQMPVRMRNGRLTAGFEANVAKGHVALRLIGQPLARRSWWQIEQGKFEQVDLGAWVPGWSTALTGTFEGRWQGASLAKTEAQGLFILEPSRINAQTVNSARLEARLQGGRLTLSASAVWPEGEFLLVGSLDSLETGPVYRIEQAVFRGLNVAAWTGQPSLQTHLNGVFMLQGGGLELRTLQLMSSLRLEASQIHNEHVSGQMRLAAAGGRWRLDGQMNAGEGQLRFEGRLEIDEERPRYALTVNAHNLNVLPIIGIDTLQSQLSLAAELYGEGLALSTLQLTGQVRSAKAHLDALTIDRLEARFSITDGELLLDTLQFESNVAAAHGSGHVALLDPEGTRTSELLLQVQLRRLDPLRRLAGVRLLTLDQGQATIRVYGRPGQLRFEGNVALQNLIYDELRLVSLNGRTAGQLDRQRELEQAEIHVQLHLLTLGTFQIEDARAELRYDGQRAYYALRLDVDPRHTARLEGQVDPGQQEISLSRFDMRLHDARWRLLQPATITYGEAYRVQGLLLYTEAQDQQLAVDGLIDPNGSQNFVLTLERFRLETITDLFDLAGLGGALSGTVDLTGPAIAPILSGQLQLELVSQGRSVGMLDLALQYERLRMAIDARLIHQEDASTLTLQGTVPVDLRLRIPEGAPPFDPTQAPLDLTIEADTFAIAWVQPFLDPAVMQNVRGRLTGHVRIRGTLAAPVLEGQAWLFEGAVYLPEFGVTYRDIRAEAVMQGNEIRLIAFELSSGGQLTGSGTIQFEALTLGALDLRMQARSFLAANNRAYRTVLSGSLRLTGTTERPELQGDIQVVSADIYLVEQTTVADLEPVQLSEADLQMLRQYFGVRITERDTITFDFYEASRMRLALRMERDVWLRSRANPEMNVQFTGTLTVQKEPYQDLQLFGTIEVIPERSYIVQFGKRFDITEGTLTFNGPADDPEMRLSARYVVPSREDPTNPVTILLSVSGRLERLDLKFSSENPAGLELPDIVSYIVFGRPAGQALASLTPGGGAGGGLLGQGAGLALAQLAGVVEGLAGEELGLDVVEIEPDGLQGAKLTVGKYVSPRLFAAVSRPIVFESGAQFRRGETYTEFTMEYTIFDAMILRVTSQGTQMRINLLWRYAY